MAIRVKPGQNTHFEFRIPSSMANPYLVLAALVCAGMDGIEKQMSPPPETTPDAVGQEARASGFKHEIPQSLEDALQALEADEVLSKRIGLDFVNAYVFTKRLEIEEMRQHDADGTVPLCYALY